MAFSAILELTFSYTLLQVLPQSTVAKATRLSFAAKESSPRDLGYLMLPVALLNQGWGVSSETHCWSTVFFHAARPGGDILNAGGVYGFLCSSLVLLATQKFRQDARSAEFGKHAS